MKWLAVLLLVSASCFGQSVVNATYFNSVTCWTGAPCANTIPATSNGNTLLVYYPSNATTPTITASGATFSAPTNCQQTFASPVAFTVALQVATAVSAGITTVTISGDASSQQIAILEVSGTSGVDVCNVGIDSTNTSPMSTASITTTQNNDFVLAFISEYFGGSPETYGWTAPCTVAGTPGSQVSAATKTFASTGATSCSSTVSNASGHTIYATIGLKTSGGGGGSSPTPTLMQLGVGQ